MCDFQVANANPITVKRKRGRPKGSKNKIHDSVGKIVMISEASEQPLDSITLARSNNEQ